MVEVEDLLAKMKIFEQCWSTRPDAKRVLIIRDGDALLGRQYRNIFACCLVQVQPCCGVSGECFVEEACFVFLVSFIESLLFESLVLTRAPLPVSRSAHRDRRLLRRSPRGATGERM